jgi:hypothetical protein
MKKQLKYYFPFVILLIPLIVYLPFLGEISFPKGSEYSDLAISHLPNAIYINRMIMQTHQIPLWNDTIMSGYPFIADPLSGLWYPPLWLANLIPSPVSFNILFLLHILLAGIGLFLFLSGEGLKTIPALIAAFTFECLPKVWSHYAAGHVTLVYAVCWTPWLLLFAQKRWQKHHQFFALTPELIILATIILCDVRWTVYAVAIWSIFSLKLVLTQDAEQEKKISFRNTLPKIAKLILHLLVEICLALSLTTIFTMPFREFVTLSTRSNLTQAQNLFLSLSPLKLLNLFIPNIGGYAEWILYIGGLGVMSLLLCLFHSSPRKNSKFWSIALAICLILSLGSYIPGLSMVYSLPIINLLRVPARINFLSGFSACCLIGYALNSLVSEKRFSSWLRLTLIAILFFIFIMGIGISLINKRFEISIFWAFFALILYMVLFMLFAKNKIGSAVFYPALIVLTAIDLLGVNFLSTDFKPLNELVKQEAETIQIIKADFEMFRIYSPSFSISQFTASVNGMSMVNGIDPLQLKTYSLFISKASGVPSNGYSVTVPSLATGDSINDNINYLPDARLLGFLNTKYLISDFPLKGSDFQLVDIVNNQWIYENQLEMPRAWVQDNENSSAYQYREVNILDYRPNSITISAQGPGILVLSEIDYPGWVAEVDGQTTPIQPFSGILRSINLETGKHTVVFEFHPKFLLMGAIISTTTACFLVIYALIKRKMLKSS